MTYFEYHNLSKPTWGCSVAMIILACFAIAALIIFCIILFRHKPPREDGIGIST